MQSVHPTLLRCNRRDCCITLLAGLTGGGIPLLGNAQPRLLRVPAVSSWGPPYGQFRDGQLAGGINYDLFVAVAEQLRLTLAPINMPRPRVDAAALAGEFDLRCQLSPDWIKSSAEAYLWTSPLFEMLDVLVGHDAIAAPRDLDQLPAGSAVSTVLGFSYPTLDERFQDGRLRREDTVAVDRALRKLSLRRTPYAVVNLRDLGWYLRNTPEHNLATWRLPVARYDYRCAVPKLSRVDAPAVIAVLERLKLQGEIDRIVLRHAPPQFALVAALRSAWPRLSRQEVLELFLGQAREAPDGRPVQLASLISPARDAFFQQVLERDAAQLKSQWSRLVFAGRAKGPIEFSDAAAARNWLANNPQALLLLPAEALDGSVKVVFGP